MKIAILTANLGNFDKSVDPVEQKTEHKVVFHRWTDDNFPPITGLTPRLQYRIPKYFGWQMLPGYNAYIRLDGTFSFVRDDCVEWFLEQLAGADVAFFKHPHRNTIKDEVDHIEEKLKQKHPYIVSRYKNGLHKEMYGIIKADLSYIDSCLYTSTAFIYRNNRVMQKAMRYWWFYQSRYYTVDQIAQPYAMYCAGAKVNVIRENQYKCSYLEFVSKHR